MPASATITRAPVPAASWNSSMTGGQGGGLGPAALPAAQPQREAGPVHQQAHDGLGTAPPLPGVPHPSEGVLLIGPEVQGGHVLQARGQVPCGGRTRQCGGRDRLPPVALDAGPARSCGARPPSAPPARPGHGPGRCSTIRRCPRSLATTCTAVAPGAVRTLRRHGPTPPILPTR